MKSWMKIVLGIAATLACLLVLGAALLVRSGKWQEIRGFSGGMVKISRSAQAMERLDQEQPFKAPADGLLPEPRLIAYLDVCDALKPSEGPYLAWMREHMGKKGDFKDAAEAVTFMAGLLDTAAVELKARGMTAREFAWIHESVRRARKEAIDKAGSPLALEMLQDLRQAARDPGLDPARARDLDEKIRRYEARIQEGREPLSPNAKLCLAHAERLRAADLGELGDMIQSGGISSKRP
jgi:hypothetical protein